MCKDKVAIALATYNGEEYLEEQLESLNKQSYKEFICYIHDDGSKDCTKKIIKKYVEIYPDTFKELVFPSCGSAKMNFWEMMKRIDSEYLFFCDQDDVWLPNKVEIMVKQIEKYDRNVPCLLFCDMTVVDRKLNIIAPSFIHYAGFDCRRVHLNELIPQNVAAGCGMVINQALKHEALKCPKVDLIRMHDWWLMLAAVCTGEIHFVNKQLQLYRQHGNNSLGAVRGNGFNAAMNRCKRLLTGIQIRQTRLRIINHQTQASQLYIYYGRKKENDNIIIFFRDITKLGKTKRILGYIKYKIFRNNKRNWWSMLWV